MIVWVALGITLFIILYLWAIPMFAVHKMTRAKRSTYRNCFDLLEQFNVFSKQEFDELDKEEVEIQSHDKLKLHGVYIEKYPRSNRVAIIVHGYTAALPWSSQFAAIFMKQGFNVLLVDQRGHGQSEGTHATFGYKEKYDLQGWVDWIVNRKGEDCVIALHGQSLGGATVLEYAAIHRPQVRCIVADCPYSDLFGLMKHQVSKLNHLPSWPLMRLINRRLKHKADFSFEDVNPLEVMKNCKLPVLFIHGEADIFVPTQMSLDLYEAKPEPKRLLLINKATHAVANCIDQSRYEAEVLTFIEQVIGPPNREDLITLADLNTQPVYAFELDTVAAHETEPESSFVLSSF